MTIANLLTLLRLAAVVPGMAAIMTVREFAVTGLRMVALEANEVIAANNWGKAKMVSQSLEVLILLLGYAALGYWTMLLATVLTLLSGWSYLKDAPRIIAATAGDRKT